MSISRISQTFLSTASRHVRQKVSREFYTTTKGRNAKNYSRLIGIVVGSMASVAGGVMYHVFLTDSPDEPKKKIVVLGSGWGAVNFLRSLKPGKYDVSVVSPDNYFLFTPLLPGVTVGTVEGRSVVEPIRKIITRKHKSDVRFFEAECTEVNIIENKVICQDQSDIQGEKQKFSLDYDYLVVSVGARTATYNIKGVQEYTHFLKNVQEAQAIRKNIMDSFETANMPGQEESEIKRLLHFVVVGGGPTGVEFAAELRDFVKSDLVRYYPKELVAKSQITLVDGLNKILNTYSEEISRYAESHFKKEGIDIVTSTFVNGVEPEVMHLKDAKTGELRTLPYGTIVWCAGIAPRDLTRKLMKDIPGQTNRMGLITDAHMKVKNTSNIFALGDCCTVQKEKLVDYVDFFYEMEGLTQDAMLSAEDFERLLHNGMRKVPHLCHHFKEMDKLFHKVDLDKDNKVSYEEFKTFAIEADRSQTALPPTAQVAAQEGNYLGKLFSKHEEELAMGQLKGVDIFRYNHLGSFAYVGDNRAVLELPVVGAFKGWSTMWLWRGAYTNEAVSLRMRVLILFDWIKSYAFGRDISRI